MLLVVALLASIPTLMKRVPKNFLPDDDMSEFEIKVRAPEGTSLEATFVVLDRISRDVRRLGGVEYTLTSVADSEQRIANEGTIYVRMAPLAAALLRPVGNDELRPQRDPAALSQAGPADQRQPGERVLRRRHVRGGRAIHDRRPGHAAAGQVPRRRSWPTSARSPAPWTSIRRSWWGSRKYSVTPDRAKADDLGVTVADVANTLSLLVAGAKVSDYNEKGEQYEVHVRASPEFRNNPEELLASFSVPAKNDRIVDLRDVVKIVEGVGPAEINRLNRKRQVTISANMVPGASQQTLLDAIERSVRELEMGPDYTTGLFGKSKEMAQDVQRSFLFVFVLAIGLVYLVIAAQFESWLHPITILMSLPLTLPFALVSLLLFHQSLNIFSLLGILVLFAVVKKNSILQIDHTNQLRAAGMPRNDAILAANRDRLRPILMTTVAFVAGMIPLLVSNSEGAAVNKAISGVVIGGQTLSLLLTLVATPVAYSLFDDLSNLFCAALWRAKRSRADGRGASAARGFCACGGRGRGGAFGRGGVGGARLKASSRCRFGEPLAVSRASPTGGAQRSMLSMPGAMSHACVGM